MRALGVVLAHLAAVQASLVQPRVSRRNIMGSAAAAVTVQLAGSSAPAFAAAPQFFETEGGVKYFDKVVGDCKLFNVACQPQEGDLIKLKYKAYLPSGQMFDSSEGPGRKVRGRSLSPDLWVLSFFSLSPALPLRQPRGLGIEARHYSRSPAGTRSSPSLTRASRRLWRQ